MSQDKLPQGELLRQVKAVFGENIEVPSQQAVEQKPEGELLREVKAIFGDDSPVDRKKTLREKVMAFFSIGINSLEVFL